MENEEKRAGAAQRLTADDLSQAIGGVGYTAIRCKKCDAVFSSMDQYQKHIAEAHGAPTPLPKRI